MQHRRILIVEDEPSLLVSLSDRLRAEGYAVETAPAGEDGLAMALASAFDLIVLDAMLPGISGFDLVRDLRRAGRETPVLMLTARSQVVDKVLGLKLGADDYLTKPFDAMELLARIEALLRRGSPAAATPEEPERYRFGDVAVDFRRAEVRRGDEEVKLAAMEYRLLRHFIAHRGELLSRDRLLDEVWGYDATPQTRTVDQHVASLRQKLEPVPNKPQYIVTVHGLGYRFES